MPPAGFKFNGKDSFINTAALPGVEDVAYLKIMSILV
jgi:hypothetical protein